MRILYIAQWFDPEPMIKGAGFVRALIERGHQVEVVTGFPNYPVGKVYPGYRVSIHQKDEVEGVPIHRVALYPSQDRSSFGRILNYFSFALSVAIHGIFRARDFDVVYSYPPLPAALAGTIIGWVRRRPFVMDIQDLWPDSVVRSGMPGVQWMGRVISPLCRFAYKRSSRIIAQSQGIAARLVERGVPAEKIDVIYNWADEQAAAQSRAHDLSRYALTGKFNIIYGGNLGRVQELDVLVRAAHLAAAHAPDLQLTLIGDGVEGDNLRALVAEIGATNVKIHPGVARAEIGAIFAAADVLTLHLAKDPLFKITVPQKTQFYMAMGKPVLAGIEGEVADLIVRSGAGLAVEPSNVEAIAGAMVEFAQMDPERIRQMGEASRKAYWANFSFSQAIGATEDALYTAAKPKDCASNPARTSLFR